MKRFSSATFLVGMLLTLIAATGCEQRMNAKELFELRSKCDEIASKKYKQDNLFDRNADLYIRAEVQSKYVPSKNKCLAFVKSSTSSRLRNDPYFEHIDRLYDAQTGTILAEYKSEMAHYYFSFFYEESHDGNYSELHGRVDRWDFDSYISRQLAAE